MSEFGSNVRGIGSDRGIRAISLGLYGTIILRQSPCRNDPQLSARCLKRLCIDRIEVDAEEGINVGGPRLLGASHWEPHLDDAIRRKPADRDNERGHASLTRKEAVSKDTKPNLLMLSALTVNRPAGGASELVVVDHP
jgi:hypothetical protein